MRILACNTQDPRLELSPCFVPVRRSNGQDSQALVVPCVLHIRAFHQLHVTQA